MIADEKELTVAARNLAILEDALRALQTQLQTQNPALLATTSGPYVRRIAGLQFDIALYLSVHPAAVSLLLNVSGRDEAATPSLVTSA